MKCMKIMKSILRGSVNFNNSNTHILISPKTDDILQ
jgi:hypothetical protein